jgi:hypothetical protein
MGLSIVRQVRAEKSALPTQHVTVAASRFAEKYSMAIQWISARNFPTRQACERSYVTHHPFDLLVREGIKSRHAFGRNAIMNNSEKFEVGSSPYRRACRNVRCMFASARIQTMAGSTSRLEIFPAMDYCHIRLAIR